MAIEARHVTKKFASRPALRDVSLNIADGELVALLGPSGSGKTTLLRIIAGLEEPDLTPDTAVLIDGVDISRQPADERRIGFVFQHYALFRHMNVFENIAFGLRVRPRKLRPRESEIRRRVNELLDLIQLGSWARHFPSQLSGGQRQRVALARSLAIEPKVLLLDEPFGALDARVRQELRRWLRGLHDKIHLTSVLVTHDQEEALEVADRVVIMNRGRIEQIGTPEEMFHHPVSEFVVSFLGNVNLFHSRVADGKPVFEPAVFNEDGSRHDGLGDNRPARVFVRPHEMEIELARTAESAMEGCVSRIQSAGALVKVELSTKDNGTITVELTHQRLRELAIKPADTVYVKVREARVFMEDYSI